MVSKLWQNYSFSSTNSKIILFEGIIYLGYFFFVMKNKITFWYGIYCGTLSLRKVTVLPPMDGKYGSGPGFARFWRIGDQFLALAGAAELASLYMGNPVCRRQRRLCFDLIEQCLVDKSISILNIYINYS